MDNSRKYFELQEKYRENANAIIEEQMIVIQRAYDLYEKSTKMINEGRGTPELRLIRYTAMHILRGGSFQMDIFEGDKKCTKK